MLESPRLLVSSQRPYIHFLCLRHLALVGVKGAEIVDRVQRRRMLESPCLLISSQRPHTHLLCLRHLALVGVKNAEIVDRV